MTPLRIPTAFSTIVESSPEGIPCHALLSLCNADDRVAATDAYCLLPRARRCIRPPTARRWNGIRRMPDDGGSSRSGLQTQSVETRASWIAAGVTLAILSLAYGSTLLIVVGLRVMELDLGLPRSTLALAGALTWVGTGL